MSEIILLLTLTFLISLLYSSVGHGGASGYLALLSFFAVGQEAMAATALCLNLLVAGLAFFNFAKARHFSWSLTWPFLAASIPCAFLGGYMRVSSHFYHSLLAAVLLFACIRMAMPLRGAENHRDLPSLLISLPVGGAIGLLSGIVGVGGGIFLSPILILCRWADTKSTAAASAFFILINSLAGLAGRYFRGGVELMPYAAVLVFAAFTGGILGSQLGAGCLSPKTLRRTLVFVLLSACFKLTT